MKNFTSFIKCILLVCLFIIYACTSNNQKVNSSSYSAELHDQSDLYKSLPSLKKADSLFNINDFANAINSYNEFVEENIFDSSRAARYDEYINICLRQTAKCYTLLNDRVPFRNYFASLKYKLDSLHTSRPIDTLKVYYFNLTLQPDVYADTLKSFRAIREMVKVFKEHNSFGICTEVTYFLGEFYRARAGDFKNSSASVRQAIQFAIENKVPNYTDQVVTYTQLALCFSNHGDTDSSLKYYQICQDIINAHQVQRAAKIIYFNNYGLLYKGLGQLTSYEVYLHKALELCIDGKFELYRRSMLINLGTLCLERDDNLGAQKYLQSGLDISESLLKQNPTSALIITSCINALLNLQEVATRLENDSLMKVYLEKALYYTNLSDQIAPDTKAAVYYYAIGYFRQNNTNNDSAIYYAGLLKDITASVSDSDLEKIAVNAAIAGARAQSGQTDEALKEVHDCLAMYYLTTNNGNSISMMNSNATGPDLVTALLQDCAAAYLVLYQMRQDEELLYKAEQVNIAFISTTQRFLFSQEPNQCAAFARHAALAYKQSMEIENEKNKLQPITSEKLFDLFENSNASILKRNNDFWKSFEKVDSGFFTNFRNAYQEKDKLMSLGANQNNADLKATKMYDSINQVLDSLNFVAKSRIPSFVPAETDAGLYSKVKSRLTAGDGIINYVINNKTIFVYCLTGSNFKFSRITFDDSLKKEIRNFQAELLLPDPKQSRETGSRLYQKLIADILPQSFNPKHLVIIPDGELHNFPFESLVVKNDHNATQYFSDSCVIRYEYSMSFLVNNSGDKPEPAQILAIAPSYNLQSSAASLNAETVNTNLLENQPELRAGLGPLKYNIDEVKDIASRFRSKDLVGESATEDRFRGSAHENQVLHFATHAFSNADNPNLSGIIFTQDKERKSSSSNQSNEVINENLENDNILHSYEIQSMNLNSELVVLSACETGVGKFQNGEGTMSLARAFKYANCPNIVTSLWKVDDASTKEIMGSFYENLGEGMGKADALAGAKRSFRKNHPNASAFYWAPFILIGDNEPVHLQRNSDKTWWLIVGGVLILFAIIVAVYRRLRVNS